MKKELLVIGITVILLAIVFSGCFEDSSIPKGKAQNVYVDDDFTSSTSGWGYDHFNSIQKAIDNVTEDGTVHVASGTYYEKINIDISMKLIGESKSLTIIHGKGHRMDEPDHIVVNISVNFVTIESLTIRSEIPEEYVHTHDDGLLVSSDNNIIRNTLIKDTGKGIILQNSNNNLLEQNSLENNYESIFLSGSSNNIIKNNVFNQPESDSYTNSKKSSDGNIISNNTFSGVSWEIYGSRNYFENNNLLDSYIAFGEGFNYILNNEFENSNIAIGSDGNMISSNTFSNLEGRAISLRDGANDSIISHNIIIDASRGIDIRSGDNNRIFLNNFSRIRDVVVWVMSETTNNNVIYHNNFFNNKINAYDDGNTMWYNDTLSEGNYWDDYNGIDTDGNGIGDTPYNINSYKQDLYPLMNPVDT